MPPSGAKRLPDPTLRRKSPETGQAIGEGQCHRPVRRSASPGDRVRLSHLGRADVTSSRRCGAAAISSQTCQREIEPLPAAVRSRDLARRVAATILASGEFTQHDLDAGLCPRRLVRRRRPRRVGGTPRAVRPAARPRRRPRRPIRLGLWPHRPWHRRRLDPYGLQWLIDAGADVAFPPLDTKYGPRVPAGDVARHLLPAANLPKKHRGIEHPARPRRPPSPGGFTPPSRALHRGDARGLAELLAADPSLARSALPSPHALRQHLPARRFAAALRRGVRRDRVPATCSWTDTPTSNERPTRSMASAGRRRLFTWSTRRGPATPPDARAPRFARAEPSIDLSISATWRTWAAGAIEAGDRAFKYAAEARRPEVAEERERPRWQMLRSLIGGGDSSGRAARRCGRGRADARDLLDC